MFAAYKDHAEIVRELLTQANIDINIKSIWIQNYSWYSDLTFW